MTPVADPLLAQGISAAKAGDKALARQLLSQAVQHSPTSETAWLWLSGVLETPQGRAFCLRKVLQINPSNELAQRGLMTLFEAERGRVLIATPVSSLPARPGRARAAPVQPLALGPPTAVAPSAPARVPRARRARRPRASGQKRFWQVTIAVLGVVALALVGTLAFAMLGRPTVAGEDLLAAAELPSTTSELPTPHGTLRPTFTPAPTDTPTPVPTPTLVPTLTPLPTDTPLPSDTPTEPPPPTLVPTLTPRPKIRSVAATATNPPAPRPPLPPCSWDSRLNALGVRVERASVGPNQPFWRLVSARWADERESAGKHTIFVEVLDAQGARAFGQTVIAQWAGGSVTLPVKNCPPPDWPADFAMFNTLGSYAVSVGGAPSDRVVGMGLGTADAPDFTIHTSFYLTFQLVRR